MRILFTILLGLVGFQCHAQYKVEIAPLKDQVYIYTSYEDMDEYGKVGANGLIIEGKKEAIIIDAPWNNEQTNQLIEWVQDSLKKKVKYVAVTHFHADRIGGIELLKEKSIPAVSGKLTSELADKSRPLPDITFKKDTTLKLDNISVELFYPGPGHTEDNIVVYVPQRKVLYGGCFLKSSTSKNLGNVADANIDKWPASIESVKRRYPDAEIVVPGHGNWRAGAIENTLKLLGEQN